MSKKLLFFEKEYFPFYKSLIKKEGKEIISITNGLLDFSTIDEVDESRQIVDISSIVGLEKLQYNAELVIPKYPYETVFIADKVYKEVFKYHLRYLFDEFIDIDIVEEVKEEYHKVKKTNIPQIKGHAKIIDLNNNEINSFLDTFKENIYGHEKFKSDFHTTRHLLLKDSYTMI